MKRKPAQAGFTLLEVSVAMVLAGAMAGLITQALLWRSAQQRSTGWRELAVIEAGNLMDQATSLADSELTQENLDTLQLPASLQGRSPAARLLWLLEPTTGELAARRITLEIQLPGKAGADLRPVRVTAWTYGDTGTRKAELGTRNDEK